MRITEAKFRKILREEALRVKLFEQETTAAPPTAPQAAPAAPAAQAAPSAAPPAPSPQDEAKAAAQEKARYARKMAEKNLHSDFRSILFGDNGKGGESKQANSMTAMLWTDMYNDWALGTDEGELSVLPQEVKEQILDQMLGLAKSGELDKDSFFNAVSTNYTETFPGNDGPGQEYTDEYWPYARAAMLRYQKVMKEFPAEAAAAQPAQAAAATTTSGAKFPTAQELAGLTPIQQVQKIVGAEPDGKWKQQTNASLAMYVSNSKAQIQGAKGAPVPINLISTNWQRAAPLIKAVNGQPKDYKPTITGITLFLRDISATPPAAPAAPAAEGSWRRGSRLVEESQKIRIRWGA